MTDPKHDRRAIVIKRANTPPVDTSEIEELAQAAGYTVVDVITQVRDEDPAYHFGKGKVVTVAEAVERTGASVVIADNELGPYQTYNIGTTLPDEVRVIDRFRLILEIFADRASTRTAQLQVELAELRYELPRAEAKTSLAKREERPGFMGLGEYDESRERDIKDQISSIRDELETISKTREHRRKRRRESGFDLVSLAGYTNAGKSTLLRRLGSDIDIDENEGKHPDLETTAASADDLFTTLGTTTRKMEIDSRQILVTDTVGFISDLPHWLVESFESTLESVYQADLVLLVVDSSDSIEAIRDKLVTAHDTLAKRNEAKILTVLNKIDELEADELEERRAIIEPFAPEPVAISAQTGEGIETLKSRIEAALPAWESERLIVPTSDDAMSFVSWLHDNARVHNEEYHDGQIHLGFEAAPAVVEKARHRSQSLSRQPSNV